MTNEKKTSEIMSIAKIVSDLFGSPCDYSPIDEEMCMNGQCEEICGSDEQTDVNCWKRYFELKLKQL